MFSNALAGLSDSAMERLQGLVTALDLWSMPPMAEITSVVADADSSALVTFGQQEGAEFGYCSKGRNRRRHHPLVGSLAATRSVVHTKYRDGSAIDAKEAIEFFGEMVRRIRRGLG